jgi:hypothetical protein
MDEDRRTKLLGHGPDRLKRCIVQIQGVNATGVRVGIHVGADLHPAQM